MPGADQQYISHPFDQDEYWLIAPADLSAVAVFQAQRGHEDPSRVVFFEVYEECVAVSRQDCVPPHLQGQVVRLSPEECMELVELRQLQHIAISRADGGTLVLDMMGHYSTPEGEA